MEEGISLLELIKASIKNIKMILIITIVVLAISIGVSFTEKARYTAKGSVLIVSESDLEAVSTINSFIQRDFILKETIETLKLDVDISNFKTKYVLSNVVDNNFINITCVSNYQDNNIRIINTIIDKLIVYQEKNSVITAKIIPTEYASYNMKQNTSKITYLAIGLILSVIFSLGYVCYKIFVSPIIQTDEELKRNINLKEVTYLKLNDCSFKTIVDKIKDKKVIVLNNVPEEFKEKLKSYYQESLFLFCSKIINSDLKRIKKENEKVFLISKSDYLYNQEVEIIINFIKIGKSKKYDIKRFFNDENEQKVVISI